MPKSTVQAGGRVGTGTQSQFRALLVSFILHPHLSFGERGLGTPVCMFVSLYSKLHAAPCLSVCRADTSTLRFVDQ